MKKLVFLIIAMPAFVFCNAQIDSNALNNVFGKQGTVTGNVYKISYPRSDLKVKVNGFAVAPGLALGTWVGIIQMGNLAMMMGDLVNLVEPSPPMMAETAT